MARDEPIVLRPIELIGIAVSRPCSLYPGLGFWIEERIQTGIRQRVAVEEHGPINRADLARRFSLPEVLKIFFFFLSAQARLIRNRWQENRPIRVAPNDISVVYKQVIPALEELIGLVYRRCRGEALAGHLRQAIRAGQTQARSRHG